MPTYARPRSAVSFRSQRDGWWRLADILAAGRPFANTTGSLRGIRHDGSCPPSLGRLPVTDTARLRRDLPRVDMIIYSYATPIAWHVTGRGWTVPDASYSRTTSRHQSLVRVAVANLPASAHAARAA